MKPVHQTRYGMLGNCWAACLASVLELPLEIVPDDLIETEDWWGVTEKWLRQFGLRLNWMFLGRTEQSQARLGFYLLGGKSPRGEWGHVVVAENGAIVHDPHPDGSGLADDDGSTLGQRMAYWISVDDPSKLSQLVEVQVPRE